MVTETKLYLIFENCSTYAKINNFAKISIKKKHILYKCTYNKYGVYDDLLKWINIVFSLKDDTRIVVKKYV